MSIDAEPGPRPQPRLLYPADQPIHPPAACLRIPSPPTPPPQALQPNDGLTLRSGQDGDDYRRDSIERDEKRLAEKAKANAS